MRQNGYGKHNLELSEARERLLRGASYKDLSTIIITPTRGGLSLSPRVVGSWMALIRPMNQKILGPMFVSGFEVGDAYNQAIEMVLGNPELSGWKYILTLEDDIMPPPDGLLKLYEAIEGGCGRKYDVVQGIYWTKGEGGQPMIYGDPTVMPKNFIPQVPKQEAVQEANGLGMGFNLFRLSMFNDGKIQKPWFKTLQEYIPGQGSKGYSQDLYFYENAGKAGYRFACDSRVKVGHYDHATDIVW